MRQGLSKGSVVSMKGLLCIAVLFHHINQCLSCFDNTIIDLVLNNLGYLAVAGFYFFSGYGLTTQTQLKTGYERKLLISKILPTYLVYLVIVFFYSIIEITTSVNSSTKTIFRTFIFGGTIVKNGWFFQSILMCYIFFWISFSIFKSNKTKLGVLSLCLAVYVAVCILMDLDAMWYQSVFCFLIGVLWKIYESKLVSFSNWLWLVVTSIAFVTLFIVEKMVDEYYIAVVIKGFSACCFVLIMIWLMYKFAFIEKIKLIKWLGKYSMEAYAFHGLALVLFRRDLIWINNDILFALCVCAFTFAFSFIIHPLFEKINKKCKVWAERNNAKKG